MREVTAGILHDLGYGVVEAGSGGAALDVFDRNPAVDLVLLDFAMPGMNGAEVARELRARRPDVSILFASGYADIQTFGEELSEDRLLKKPYRIADVAARIAAILSAHRASADVVPLRRS